MRGVYNKEVDRGGDPVHDESTDPLIRFRHTTCLHCGYDMRGAVSDAACPECGRAFHPGYIVGNETPRGFKWAIVWNMAFLLIFALTMGKTIRSNITTVDVVMALIFVGVFLFNIWMFLRGRPLHKPIAIMCNAHGWATRVLKNKPSGMDSYAPWTDCRRIDVLRADFLKHSFTKRRSWWLRIYHRHPLTQQHDAGMLRRHLISTVPKDEARFTATVIEAAALEHAINALLDIAKHAPADNQEAADE
jgi:hypothetical protein